MWIWALAFFAAKSLAAPKAVDVRVIRSPQFFLAEVARYCVSSPDSKFEQITTGFRVREERECAAELKALGRAWDSAGKRTLVVAIRVPLDRQAVVKQALAEEKGKVDYLLETRSCPCLVFRGPRAREWAEAGQVMAIER
jgi:hypothetical protein